jgi:hypothetical protein
MRAKERLRTLLVVSGAVIGILLTAWGLWVLYVGIANVDPGSEIPRWLAFPLAAALLAVGAWLLTLVRSEQRRKRVQT